MDDTILTLTHATERDIDLLLVEEFVCGPDLLRTVLSEGLRTELDSIGYRSHRVIHSLRRVHNRREIDICIEIEIEGAAPAVLLIENKLDTSEQVDQSKSYRAEAELLVSSGRASKAWTMLVSPSKYVRANQTFASEFDGSASYELIRDAFVARARTEIGELGARLRHRAAMLDQAIEKQRRGYTAVPLSVIGDFNERYVALLHQKYPKLVPGPAMLKPATPGESVTMIFGPRTLPAWPFLPQMRLVHQLREANANLCFYGWGNQFIELAEPLAALTKGLGYKLQPTINRRKSGRSGLRVITATEAVDNQQAFDQQVPAILDGMAKADALRLWLGANRSGVEAVAARLAR
jgi:hypothetical protein